MTVQIASPDAYRLFHRGMQALARMEANGIKVDVEVLDKAVAETDAACRELLAKMRGDPLYSRWRREFGERAKITSSDQLSAVLFDKLGIPYPPDPDGVGPREKPDAYTETGKRITKDFVLDQIDLPFVRDWQRFKDLDKLNGTFLKGLKRETVDGFLHAFFNLHTVTTYRGSSGGEKADELSAKDFNFQNLPVRNPELSKVIRSCFVPRKRRRLVENDFSALEFCGCACVVGDTAIETIDGSQTIKQVIARVNAGEDVYVYGYSFGEERISVSKVKEGGLTRKKAEVWKVLLDNGEEVIATPDHKFLLRNEEYRQLKDLKTGDSLMPFYQKKKVSQWKTVYKQIYLNNGKRMMAHNLIALDLFGVEIGMSGKVVHHWDGNGCNNSLSNIEIMPRRRHMKIHAVEGWDEEKNPGRRERHKQRMQTEEVRERTRQMMERRKAEWTEQDWKEWCERLKEGIRKNGGHGGERNGMHGKRHSEEAKKLMREKKKGKRPKSAGWNKGLTKDTNESLRAASEKLKGRTPPHAGKIKTEDRTCPQCKTVFTVPCYVRKECCGYRCAALLRESNRENPMKGKSPWCKGKKWHRATGELKKEIESTCEWCGGEFIQLDGLHRRRFCNLSCSAYHREAVRRNYNHRVVAIAFVGYEDVYNITVEGFHNYATSAGVIIKNCFWNDEKMIAYASDPAKDIHRDMAAKLFDCPKEEVDSKTMRYVAKNQFVFPELYGSYHGQIAPRIWEALDKLNSKTVSGTPVKKWLKSKGIDTLDRYAGHVEKCERWFMNEFSAFANKKEDWYNAYRKRGSFRMLTGFVCHGLYSKNFLLNAPVQGMCFHWCLETIIKMQQQLERRRMRSLLVGQIHDCIIGDVPEDEVQDYLKLIKRVVQEHLPRKWSWITVPLKIEAEVTPNADDGGNWYQKAVWVEKEGVWRPK